MINIYYLKYIKKLKICKLDFNNICFETAMILWENKQTIKKQEAIQQYVKISNDIEDNTDKY